MGDGRNELGLTNSGAKVLIENWVEERAVAQIDRTEGEASTADVQRRGHKGILSTSFESKIESLSTVKDAYRSPSSAGVKTVGKRKEQLEREIRHHISQEVHEEFNPPPPKPDYVSTTKKDFTKEFTPIEKKPTKEHHLYKELPSTFWKEQVDHHQGVTGITRIASKEKCFQKNAAFSTPIGEYMGSPCEL
ncbi:sperm-associated antigen 8-like [Oscarella lobularis]|uniref:sperm-associated antigen 8-like n=1 Tax=Oscarella lobularis TaxID=121494 RepID=UPI0033140D36